MALLGRRLWVLCHLGRAPMRLSHAHLGRARRGNAVKDQCHSGALLGPTSCGSRQLGSALISVVRYKESLYCTGAHKKWRATGYMVHRRPRKHMMLGSQIFWSSALKLATHRQPQRSTVNSKLTKKSTKWTKNPDWVECLVPAWESLLTSWRRTMTKKTRGKEQVISAHGH